MKLSALDEAEAALAEARAYSGYAMTSHWAVEHGSALIAEIKRLRTVVRVNALRAGASDAEINDVLEADR